MDKLLIQNRLTKLRDKMSVEGITYFLIPTGDTHLSEYVSDYFKVREYFSGFSGSSGSLLVWQDGAGLWTDGRYFIQAAKQLEGTGITLYKMQEEGVPTIEEFLKEQIKVGEVLGFDGRLLRYTNGLKLSEAVKEKGAEVNFQVDPAEGIWELDAPGADKRSPLPANPVFLLPDGLSGESTGQKLAKLRTFLKEQKGDGIFVSKLDELMWLFNIRGGDVACNPVALSYGYITLQDAFLFLQEKAVTEEVRSYLADHEVKLEEYANIQSFLAALPNGLKVLVDEDSCNFTIAQMLGTRRHKQTSPMELWKAIKNPVEIANSEETYLKDSVAVTKFIYWLKKQMENISEEQSSTELTECSAAAYLDHLRSQIPGFLDLSFPTISAYRANGAMIHYETSEEHDAPLQPEGFLLVDSGGQYMGGTTDITRTIALGSLTEEEKLHYTLTAAGMLSLTAACWEKGCTGRNLDILARAPLWKHGLDYRHGTGHGIGYMLNVHEGPQNLAWKYRAEQKEAVLEEGMIISNEPGIYIEGSHGIRIENILLTRDAAKTEYGQFLHFQTLTYVPLEKDAIAPQYLTGEQLDWLNAYQQMVYEKISPYLTSEESAWLKQVTSPIIAATE
jgi:Xaa-Pro aminopeptidase